MKRCAFILNLSLLLLASLYSQNGLEIYTGRNFFVAKRGEIYTDYGSNQIFRYSSNGELLNTIGRKGRGPGDLTRIGWFNINNKDNLVYVTEFIRGNRWVSKFNQNGKYIGNWNIEFDWNQWQGIGFIDSDINGDIYLYVVKNSERKENDISVGRTTSAILKYSHSGKFIKKFHTTEYDFTAYQKGRGEISLPYTNYLYFKVAGDKIVIRENNSEYLIVKSLDGKEKKRVKLPFKKELLTERDLDKWKSILKANKHIYRNLKFWMKKLSFPKYLPISGGLILYDGKNSIFSMKFPKNGIPIYAKIDLNSYVVKTTIFNNNEQLLFIKDGHYFLERNIDNTRKVYKVKFGEAQ